MIVPQLALGGCTPIDRNDRADSVSTVVAIISGSITITVVITFGKISLNIRRKFDAPWAIAASTYSFSRTESTCPRTGRKTYGTYTSAMMVAGTQRLDGSTWTKPQSSPFGFVSRTVAREIARR